MYVYIVSSLVPRPPSQFWLLTAKWKRLEEVNGVNVYLGREREGRGIERVSLRSSEHPRSRNLPLLFSMKNTCANVDIDLIHTKQTSIIKN